MLGDNRPLMFTEDLFTDSLKVPAGEFKFSAYSMVTNRVNVPVNAKPGRMRERPQERRRLLQVGVALGVECAPDSPSAEREAGERIEVERLRAVLHR